ncbi:serine/threonine-protein kinase [Streptomyces turgidiscabies]|uniref:non-specific serine/threonine protein kinase n=1 Tax=Streptomyces turgidiscabies TaxID=85558 RepID=A0ABU0RFV9_9ACTN|nr:serine/threonine protein kinase [Streptomyces turgidiscabies]
MGRVWRAVDEILDRPVAVKEMRIDGLDAEDTRTRRERTLREARATARIDHPNVVRVYDVVDEGERLWIVMELVAGRSLEQLLAQDGPLSPGDTARLGLGLVSALRQVHAGGVLHRDIKPGNVLVERRDGRVVLTDFGIAAIQDAKALTMVGMLVGSPDYMAPERVSGRHQGPPSDVWSLGATLCAALGRRSPFARETTLATLHAVLYEDPELPADAGPLRDLLAALLEKEPSARPALEDVERALRPVAFPEPELEEGAGEESEPQTAEAPEIPAIPETPDGRPDTTPSTHVQPHEDTPTPAYLDASLVTAARQPREQPPAEQAEPQREQEAPEPPRLPPPPTDAVPAGRTAVTPFLGTPSPEASHASTEAPSEMRSEVGSAIPTTRSAGISLIREQPRTDTQARVRAQAQAVTERRPAEQSLRQRALGPDPQQASGLPTVTGTPPPQPPPDPQGGRGPRHGRRRVGMVVAGVLTAGTVVGLVLAATAGSPGDRNRATPGSSPETSTSAPYELPTPRSADPTTLEPTSDPTPEPTVEGTSRPRSLPPGAHEESGGYAWATPKGWRRDVKTGAEVHYTSPDGAQELLAKSSLARGELLETWEESERNARQGQDYTKITLAETTYQDQPAVVWEYTFTLDGTHWHARLLGFDVEGKSYQISTWYHQEIEDQAVRTYEQVKESFTVL